MPKKTEFLVPRSRNKAGDVTAWQWKPSDTLRKASGMVACMVPLDLAAREYLRLNDLARLEAVAIADANKLTADARLKATERKLEKASNPEPEPIKKRTGEDHSLSALVAKIYVTGRLNPDMNFDKKAPLTRRNYRTQYKFLEVWSLGGKPGERPKNFRPLQCHEYTRQQMIDLDQSLRDTGKHGMANAASNALCRLFEFAVEINWIKSNPFIKPPFKEPKKSGMPWPKDAFARFLATGRRMGGLWTMAADLAEIQFWLGQRPGDVVNLLADDYDNHDGTLSFSQSKTAADIPNIPIRECLPHIAKIFEDYKRRRLRDVPAALLFKLPQLFLRPEGSRRWKWTPMSVGTLQRLTDNIRDQMEIDMLTEAGWHRREDGSWWDNRKAAAFKRQGAGGELLNDMMADEQRRDASFRTKYKLVRKDLTKDRHLLHVSELKFCFLRATMVVESAESDVKSHNIRKLSGHKSQSVDRIFERYNIATSDAMSDVFNKRLARYEAEGEVVTLSEEKRDRRKT